MFDLLKQARGTAKKAGCQFADARYLAILKQRVMSGDPALSSCGDSDDRGWYFSHSFLVYPFHRC